MKEIFYQLKNYVILLDIFYHLENHVKSCELLQLFKYIFTSRNIFYQQQESHEFFHLLQVSQKLHNLLQIYFIKGIK